MSPTCLALTGKAHTGYIALKNYTQILEIFDIINIGKKFLAHVETLLSREF